MQKHHRVLGVLLLMFFSLSCYLAHAAGAGSITVGTTLPAFKLPGPTATAEQEYLGLKGSDPFTLSQVSGKLIMIEFLSVM